MILFSILLFSIGLFMQLIQALAKLCTLSTVLRLGLNLMFFGSCCCA